MLKRQASVERGYLSANQKLGGLFLRALIIFLLLSLAEESNVDQ